MEPMARALEVSERELLQWSARPETMPPSVHEQVKAAAKARVRQIHEVIARLDEYGIKGSQSRALSAQWVAAHASFPASVQTARA